MGSKVSLYEYIVRSGEVVDHHESDLYFPDNPRTRHAVYLYQENGGSIIPQQFTSTDGTTWFEAPFAYDPFWQEKEEQ